VQLKQSEVNMSKKQSKSYRFDLRATADQRSVIEQAALIKHCSVTSFILDAAYKSASKVIEENAAIHLSTTDWRIICQSLELARPISSAARKIIKRKER